MTRDSTLSYFPNVLHGSRAGGGATDGGQAGDGDGGGGSGMEARLAKLEAHVEHIDRSISDIKADVREIKGQMRSDFRVLFGALITATFGLAGLMGAGFGWF